MTRSRKLPGCRLRCPRGPCSVICSRLAYRGRARWIPLWLRLGAGFTFLPVTTVHLLNPNVLESCGSASRMKVDSPAGPRRGMAPMPGHRVAWLSGVAATRSWLATRLPA